MLKYKLKENAINPDSSSPMVDYLKSLGIAEEDVPSFLDKPRANDEISPWDLDDMEKAVELLHFGFINKKKFFLVVDCDVDGFTSSAMFYRYFKLRYPEADIQWILHDGKEHGIEMHKIPEDREFIIVPDAGSAQIEEQAQLCEQGRTLIIMDHHMPPINRPTFANLAFVNNQSSMNFTNKALSGAGVVLKTLLAYEETYPDMNIKAAQFYDLAALGIISDMMNTRTLDNNAIIYKGLHSIQNAMFKALLDKQSFKINNSITKFSVAFYIAPLINGVIRMGEVDDKEVLFKGFIEEPTSAYIDTVCRGNSHHETFYEYAARNSYNVKNKQDAAKLKCFDALRNKIETLGLNNNKVIVVTTSQDDKVPVPQNLTGIIANELLKYYGKPVLVLRPRMDNGKLNYAGSGRGKQFEGFSSFLNFVRSSDYSDYGEGHDMAFGASLAADKLDEFVAECNDRLKDLEVTSDYLEVDAIFKTNRVNKRMLFDFAAHEEVYGNNIPNPVIAIEGAVNASDIKIQGKNQDSVRIMIDGVPCVAFKNKELVDTLSKGDRFNIKMTGQGKLNFFLGNTTVQYFISNIEVSVISKTLF